MLTASRAGEYSYEGTPLPDAATNRSVFTAALVDGLRGGDADRDRDGYISVEDAYAYAADQVKAAGGTQNPQRWLYGAEGEIVLARNPRGVANTAAPLPEALRLSLDSPYPDIRRGAVATLATWLASADPREVLAAQQALQLIASQDSPSVAAAARDLLQTADPRSPGPAPAAAPPAGPPQQSHGDRMPARQHRRGQDRTALEPHHRPAHRPTSHRPHQLGVRGGIQPRRTPTRQRQPRWDHTALGGVGRDCARTSYTRR